MTSQQQAAPTAETKASAGIAFIDGDFCAIEDAKISVLDWGVVRSDCTYDVVHIWQGRFFRLDAHIDRFLQSVAKLHLELPHSRAELESILHECVRRTGLQDAYLSMTCTRGRPAPGSRDPRSCVNTFYCFAVPFVWIASPEQQETGIEMYVSDIPRIPPQSVDPTVKNYHWMDMQMALLAAYENGAQTVVLKDLAGNITEGPGYNVFALHEGTWHTPADGVLQGVTRRTVLELCDELGFPAHAGTLDEETLRNADEIVITSTAGGIMPVVKLDGEDVGGGAPGAQSLRLRSRYWERHADPAWSTAVQYDE